MKNIIIIGATGSLAQYVIEAMKKPDDIHLTLRPDWFTNGSEVNYQLTRKGEPETGTAITRKSIAAFIATIIEDPGLYKNENLGISKPN